MQHADGPVAGAEGDRNAGDRAAGGQVADQWAEMLFRTIQVRIECLAGLQAGSKGRLIERKAHPRKEAKLEGPVPARLTAGVQHQGADLRRRRVRAAERILFGGGVFTQPDRADVHGQLAIELAQGDLQDGRKFEIPRRRLGDLVEHPQLGEQAGLFPRLAPDSCHCITRVRADRERLGGV